ncbi:DAGAT-domain-containing protein [Pseudovirgaria hyperparasitica]|uniref:Diacylglycerol O-acyltransferase n=1 Tax=Pseudovirgaria hyperparasitica TaxID=470096 RepID=A0A6A6VSE8_9PEZI|nr:DAGAT-domain-containing protein [Pseudovirgaria hyperparasitica]KAF2752799.1 DAGAT-domain-containing protein [Pseudovirgaria hyperparasitica]
MANTEAPSRNTHDESHTYAEVTKQPLNNADSNFTEIETIPPIQANGKPLSKSGTTTPSDTFEGTGQDISSHSPSRRQFAHKRQGSIPKQNGPKKARNNNDDHVVFEELGTNGGKLTSVKPSNEYERQLHQDKKEEKPSDGPELVSGRQAGQGWARSKIRFAPLNVPLQRRLQTLIVLMHTLSIVGLVALFFLLCTIPLLWPILLPYLIYVLFSKAATSGELLQRSDRARRLSIWSLFASYFPARLHRLEELPPTRKYIFGYHPHGIISHGAFAAFATEALGFSQLFPGITNSLLTLDSNFRLPLYREYALRLGLASVSRESCENLLTKGGPNKEGMGRAITVVIGGARESLEAMPNTMKLVLARRKGFVKIAIRTGADLVPVIGFGENDLYDQFDANIHPWVHKLQLLVKKIAGFTIPLFHARGVFNYDVGMMPYRRPLNIVVGRPVKVMAQEKPDPEYVDQVHDQYVTELKNMWEDWKDTFAKGRTGDLEIVD